MDLEIVNFAGEFQLVAAFYFNWREEEFEAAFAKVATFEALRVTNVPDASTFGGKEVLRVAVANRLSHYFTSTVF